MSGSHLRGNVNLIRVEERYQMLRIVVPRGTDGDEGVKYGSDPRLVCPEERPKP